MDIEDSCRKERIETDDKRIDIVVKDDDVLIEVERGTVFTGNSWIRLDWKDWKEVMKVIRRLKSNGNEKNKKIVSEKKIKGLRNRKEMIRVRLIDDLIEIEDMILREKEVNCVGNIYLYKEEWEKLKKSVDELIQESKL